MNGALDAVSCDEVGILFLELTDRRIGILQMVISNLLFAAAAGCWLSYSRDRNFYTGRSRHNGPFFTYANVAWAVEYLGQRGLIQERRSKPGDLHVQSTMCASQKLLRYFDIQSLSFSHRACDPIRLRQKRSDGSKVLINYPDTSQTRRWRQEMQHINAGISTIQISSSNPTIDLSRPTVMLGLKLINLTARQLHRVFNNNWRHGGRLYGGLWQGMPKDQRELLLINGSPTTERDFTQIHYQFLYAIQKVDLIEDVYTDPALSSRREGKLALNILLNCSSIKSAAPALMNRAREEGILDPDGKLYSYRQAKFALERMAIHNAPISSSFLTGIGLRLQAVDSELLVRILLGLMQEGVIGLPVHDSVIVESRHAPLLKRLMQVELDKILKELRENGLKKNPSDR